ncbi:AraC family transcriptional regulator [Streptomyces capparidis]
MDVLSDAIALLRTGAPRTARARRTGRWSERHGPVPGAGFHVVLRGRCRLLLPDGPPVALGPGDVVLLPRGAEHGLADPSVTTLAGIPPGCPEPTPHTPRPPDGRDAADPAAPAPVDLLCGAYELDRDVTHPLLARLPDVVHLPATVGGRPALRAAVDLLGQSAAEPGPGSGAARAALLDLLLVHMIRAYADQRAARGPGHGLPAEPADPAVAAALRSMHRDPARPWTVAQLAEVAGLSRAAFARRFTALVGQPPLTYLTRWRLAAAARMLRETDAPLAAVAARVGYSSQFAFANAFKREYGQAAGGYRRRWRERAEAAG